MKKEGGLKVKKVAYRSEVVGLDAWPAEVVAVVEEAPAMAGMCCWLSQNPLPICVVMNISKQFVTKQRTPFLQTARKPTMTILTQLMQSLLISR